MGINKFNELQKKLTNKKLILASGSPRRKELMSGLDLDFIVETNTDFDEVYDESTPHDQIPILMAEGKSNGFHRQLCDNEILITSDTMVLCGTTIMGKPKDREDAYKMLRFLSGKAHEVISAVHLRDNSHKMSFKGITKVFFKELTDDEIYYYIDHHKPFDKAGAYGVQEWIGYIGIDRIEGSYFNVMGFPVALFYDKLLEFLNDF